MKDQTFEGKPEAKARILHSDVPALLLAVVGTAIAIATYLGHNIEKHKQLELAYIAKLSLVSPEAGPAVKVTFNGHEIERLTKLSARLTNTGALSIEGRDIEQQPSISFDQKKARVLQASLTDNPRGVKAECRLGGENNVVISLGLLNPGEWVGFEVLFDGDPGNDWPEPNFRITGVLEPIMKVPSSRRPSFRVGYFALPRLLEYILIVVASGAPIGLLVLAGVAAADVKEAAVPSARVIADNLKKLEGVFDPKSALKASVWRLPTNLTGALGYHALSSPDPRWLDDPDSISETLSAARESPAPGQELQNMRSLTHDIFVALRAQVLENIADQVYTRLPAGPDKAARDAVRSVSPLPASDERGGDLIRKAKDAAVKAIEPKGLLARLRRVGTDDLVGLALCLVWGSALALVVTGGWNVLLNGSR